MSAPQRLTEARVHELADALFAKRQKRPSAQAIVAANGNYGSAVSAGKYLKTWEAPTGQALQLSTPLQSAIAGIQKQLEAESHAKIAAIESEAVRKITLAEDNTHQLQAQLDAQLQETIRLSRQISDLDQQLSEERLARREMEDKLREELARAAQTQDAIAGLSQAIETLGLKVDKIPALWEQQPAKGKGQAKKSRAKKSN